MEWLNYHHLLYFWLVAREGSLSRASAELRLAPSTLSGQIRALERAIGEPLFAKSGRNLTLTEIGRVVFRYSDEIFGLGRELQDVLKGRSTTRPRSLFVGIADVVPKLVAQRLLEPAMRLPEPVRIVCSENKPDRLLAELAVNNLDVVLSDTPVSPTLRVRAYNHLLGECGIAFFATSDLARTHKRKFPKSLDGAPMLLPTENTSLRRSLDHWFLERNILPKIVGEFEDSALLNSFGHAGAGIFAAPSVIARELERQHQVREIGRVDEIKERFYAISIERKLTHPAVVAVSKAARAELFG